MINRNSDSLEFDGYEGTWYVIDEMECPQRGKLYLVESEQDGDDAYAMIVTEDGEVLQDEVTDGFEEYVPKKKYRVFGETVVVVTIEVEAESEEDAREIAGQVLYSLTPYAGNGGTDKLIGVDSNGESVSADDGIEWKDVEEIGWEYGDSE
jgi:hypothetical protein